ncbi:claudin-4 [Haplochromis burtoni]|uniref:claudin-4 n=1 Tax=Haplochromis burtoni TaxID=8153 RepID=UPI0003BCDF0F|nr:claudin-4 [Haplochromis burtoni]
MVACERQLLGLALAIIGFVGTISICALPTWTVHKVNHQSSNNVQSEGLWKACDTVNAEHVECKQYGKRLYISLDLEVARVLIIIAIIIGVFGILLGVVGSKFINFVPDEMKKSKIAMVSGVAILFAGLFVLIPVCWTTITITYVLQGDRVKSEPGALLYIGWITTALLFLGGGLLCSSFICRDGTDQDVEYVNPHSL